MKNVTVDTAIERLEAYLKVIESVNKYHRYKNVSFAAQQDILETIIEYMKGNAEPLHLEETMMRLIPVEQIIKVDTDERGFVDKDEEDFNEE